MPPTGRIKCEAVSALKVSNPRQGNPTCRRRPRIPGVEPPAAILSSTIYRSIFPHLATPAADLFCHEYCIVFVICGIYTFVMHNDMDPHRRISPID